ncbi:hypothetical protein [Streptomyces sp. NBC_00347]|uniref:hypothetical protein n=1 Tax=Streptomyces sp. NBC_00347 TaxID=2975721 RepID=UPI00225783F0|nr:hypothetical protein [Streptomyces sp. NBC_00347]MCX5124988.1 hypothetical protein [Streptomyces sp. NBC_00347]
MVLLVFVVMVVLGVVLVDFVCRRVVRGDRAHGGRPVNRPWSATRVRKCAGGAESVCKGTWP